MNNQSKLACEFNLVNGFGAFLIGNQSLTIGNMNFSKALPEDRLKRGLRGINDLVPVFYLCVHQI